MRLDFGGDEFVDGCNAGEKTGFVLWAREDVEVKDVEPRTSER